MQATDYALNTLDYVGSRVASKASTYAYVYTGWKGTLPAGITRIDSPTNTVFLQLRTFVNQSIAGDLENVVNINRHFSLLNEALGKDMVVAGEESLMAQFAPLGIGLGQTLDTDALSEAQKRGLQSGIDAAEARLLKRFENIGVRQGTWDFAYDLGDYGHNFISRSTAARYGYGAKSTIHSAQHGSRRFVAGPGRDHGCCGLVK